MNNQIDVILFDMGGTLRNSVKKDEASKLRVVTTIVKLLGADDSPQVFARMIADRFIAYQNWARETLIELNESELWTRWILPDWPEEKINILAIQLNELWREATAEKIVFPETKEVIVELFRRGYRLGIVSNTVSSLEIPRMLQVMGLSGYFETIILSCEVGVRKPDKGILLEATRRMRVEPAQCAYVGNLLNRDVQAARDANFAKVIIRRDGPSFLSHQSMYPDLVADEYIDGLLKLLDIFPRQDNHPNQTSLYKASLSTMWAKNNFVDLPDFFECANRLGFSAIELNHQIDSSMLAGVNFNRYRFSSVHEPCPSDISTEELKTRDWLISSTNEENRKQGVKAIMRSIDLAHQLNTPVIVVHCGMVSPDFHIEKKLRKLFDDGKATSDEYLSLKQKMIEFRQGLITPCFEAVKKSLLELLDYAAPHHFKLGLENRYHFYDIPGLDEMGELLEMATSEQLGFVFDVGHAQALDRLGFYPFEEWLIRYSSRMIEVHLHDVIGVNDHYVPGLGDVDFEMVASYLPKEALRTFELQSFNSFEQVKTGLNLLIQSGCVKLNQ